MSSEEKWTKESGKNKELNISWEREKQWSKQGGNRKESDAAWVCVFLCVSVCARQPVWLPFPASICSLSPSPFFPSLSLQRGLMRLGYWIPEQLTATHTDTHTHTPASIRLLSAKRRGDEPAPSEHKHSSSSSHLSLWVCVCESVCACLCVCVCVWLYCFHLAAFILSDWSALWSATKATDSAVLSLQTISLTSMEGRRAIRESTGNFTAAQSAVSLHTNTHTRAHTYTPMTSSEEKGRKAGKDK